MALKLQFANSFLGCREIVLAYRSKSLFKAISVLSVYGKRLLGGISVLTENGWRLPCATTNYTYNGLGRITSANGSAYTYDNAGNLLSPRFHMCL